MAESLQARTVGGRRPGEERPTLGLLVAEFASTWGQQFLTSMADAAKALDVNLFCFVGGRLTEGTVGELEGLYRWIDAGRFDGLVVAGNVMYDRPIEVLHRLRETLGLPLVGVVMAADVVPTVLSDNFSGMYDAVEHLVVEHGYHHIAFIRGPIGLQSEADVRYRAYTQALADHDIPLDPDLVVTGNYAFDSGYGAMRALLKRGTEIDVVVAANDSMALGAIDFLNAQGISVPEDIAVVGFDDVPEARHQSVPLTTVRQPTAHMAETALSLLLQRVRGQEVPAQVSVPTELVVRRSCGCLPTLVRQVMSESDATLDGDEPPEIVPEEVWAAFEADLHGAEAQAAFPRALDQALRRDIGSGRLDDWYSAISRMRQHALTHLEAPEVLRRAEDLLQQAWILVGDVIRRAETLERQALTQQRLQLQHVDTAFSDVLSLADLTSTLEYLLPFVEIRRCYAVLHADDEAAGIAGTPARLLIAYPSPDTRAIVDRKAPLFPAERMLPEGTLSVDERYTFILLPLVVRDHQMGFTVMDVGSRRTWDLYQRLAQQLSSALFRILLMRQQQQTRQQVEDAGREAQDALRDALVAQRRYAREGWQGRVEDVKGYVHSEATQKVTDEAWLPGMREAVQETKLVVQSTPEGGVTLAIPITLYGEETIGVLAFEREDDGGWDSTQLALVRAVAEETALALENQRLLSDVQQRAARLLAASEISRAATSILSLGELLPQAVDLIRERFDLYYVGIFLVDEQRRWAVLRAGTGEAGRLMLERGHKLEVGGQSMIGTCVATGEARITFDVEREAVHRRNPLLPDTRSELALPLFSRGEVIGAMTIQDTQPGAFVSEDITILQTMADQLGNAIANARLIRRMERSMRELEIASGRYTRESWQDFSRHLGRALGYRYRLVDVEPTDELTPEARDALRNNTSIVNRVTSESAPDELSSAQSGVGVPIRLRDETLGVLNLRFEGETIPPDAVEMVEQIADRLGVSLESARLLQASLRRAEQERLAAQASAQMRENLDVDTVLQNAARAIRDALDLHRVTLRLAPRRAPSDEG